MRYAAFCIFFVFLSCKGKDKPAETGAKQTRKADSSAECQAQRNLAISDHDIGSMKYYFYGIAYPSKEVVRQFKELHITPVVKDCAPEKAGLCYNLFVDSIMFAEYRVNMAAIK